MEEKLGFEETAEICRGKGAFQWVTFGNKVMEP